ncbi:MAG: acylphosphatase [Mangrovibacterium sp.]
MERTKAFHISCVGRVQGVGFRHFVRKNAIELNLNGWVRNNPDGSVEVEVEGDEDIISVFLEILKSGNSFSRVDRIFKTELPDLQHYRSFFIKY